MNKETGPERKTGERTWTQMPSPRTEGVTVRWLREHSSRCVWALPAQGTESPALCAGVHRTGSRRLFRALKPFVSRR